MRASARWACSALSPGPRAHEGGGEARGGGIARSELDAGLAQASFLTLELLRIGAGTAHGSDEDELTPARCSSRRGDGRREGSGGIGMRAVAQHHVEKD